MAHFNALYASIMSNFHSLISLNLSVFGIRSNSVPIGISKYEIIALSPSSPQEIYDLTILAFNLSEKYRVPVLVMSDEVVGHGY